MDFGLVPVAQGHTRVVGVDRLGTSPSAFGTGIAWLFRPALRGCLAAPRNYRKKDCWGQNWDHDQRTLACIPAFPNLISLFSFNSLNKWSRDQQPLSLPIPWVKGVFPGTVWLVNPPVQSVLRGWHWYPELCFLRIYGDWSGSLQHWHESM